MSIRANQAGTGRSLARLDRMDWIHQFGFQPYRLRGCVLRKSPTYLVHIHYIDIEIFKFGYSRSRGWLTSADTLQLSFHKSLRKVVNAKFDFWHSRDNLDFIRIQIL